MAQRRKIASGLVGLLTLLAVAQAGCGGSVSEAAVDATATPADVAVSIDSAESDSMLLPETADAAEPRPDAERDTLPALDCLSLPDEGTAEALSAFEYRGGACVSPPDGGSCLWRIYLDPPCGLAVEESGPGSTRLVTLPPDECKSLKRWLTSETWRAGLASVSSCQASVPTFPDPPELSTVRTASWTFEAVNSAFCDREPFIAHRRCIAAIRAKYFKKK